MRTTIILLVALALSPLWAHGDHTDEVDGHSHEPATSQSVMLEALGVFSGVGAYMTFAAIGSLVDAHQAGAYDREMTLSIIGEYIAFNQTIIDYLGFFTRTETLSEEDSEVMKGLSVAYMLMNEQLMAYATYIHTEEQVQLDAYAARRDEAWTIIADIYGFNREENE